MPTETRADSGAFANVYSTGAQPHSSSQPASFDLSSPKHSIIVDKERHALYVLLNEPIVYPDPQFSANQQNWAIFLQVSFDNGKTWSRRVWIADTVQNNRFYPTGGLNKGALYFGFYDARNDAASANVQYFGAVLNKSKMDKIVKKLRAELGQK